MKENKDYIIVGSGLGGMFAAATLAYYGQKVTVIEAHYTLGGYASHFKRKNCIHEIALHAVELPAKGTFRYHWFKKLGVFDHVDFVRTPEYYDFYCGDRYFKVPVLRDDCHQYLVKEFPHEKEGLNSYFDCVKRLELEVDSFLNDIEDPLNQIRLPVSTKLSRMKILDFLNEIIQDKLLIKVLTGTVGYFHHTVENLSALVFMYGQSFYLREGQHFIKGTSHSLHKYLKDFIEKNGGQFLMGHLVESLNQKEGRVDSIQVYKKSTGERLSIKADEFIFNNSPVVVKQWLGRDTDKLVISSQVSKSAFVIFLEFNEPPRNYGVKAYANLINLEYDNKFYISLGPNFGFVDYSQIDSGLSEDKYLAAVLYADEYEYWSHLSKENYQEQKKKRLDEATKLLDHYFPGLMSVCSRAEVATPMTMERYTQNPEGAIYAFSSSMNNISHTEDNIKINGVDNIHFASAWVFGAGFSLSLSAGLKVALDLMDKDYYDD